MTRTTGYVDGNFRKTFAVAASKTFELGTANGYTPVIFNATAGTFPTDVTVAAIQTAGSGHPAADQGDHPLLEADGDRHHRRRHLQLPRPGGHPGHGDRGQPACPAARDGKSADYSDQGGTVNTAANTPR